MDKEISRRKRGIRYIMTEKLLQQEKQNRPALVKREWKNTIKEEIVNTVEEHGRIPIYELEEEIGVNGYEEIEPDLDELLIEGILAEVKPAVVMINPYYTV